MKMPASTKFLPPNMPSSVRKMYFFVPRDGPSKLSCTVISYVTPFLSVPLMLPYSFLKSAKDSI